MTSHPRQVQELNRNIELLNRFHQESLAAKSTVERYHLFLEAFSEAFNVRFAMLQQFHSSYRYAKTLAVKGQPETIELLKSAGMDFGKISESGLLWPVDQHLLKKVTDERTIISSFDEALQSKQLPEGAADMIVKKMEPGIACILGIFNQDEIIGEVVFFLQPGASRPLPETLELFRSQLSMLLVQEQSRQKLSDQERRWRFALESSGDGVWDYDVQTGEQFVSERWADMLGYRVEEIQDPRALYDELLHPEDKNRVLDKWNRFAQGNTDLYLTTFRIRHKSGRYKWVLSRGKVVERDTLEKPKRIMGTHTDVTKQKQMEEVLRKNNEKMKEYNRRLEKSVHLKEVRLKAMEEVAEERQRADQANHQKELLFASLSHDLRNPLSALTGMVDLMLMEETDPSKREYLDIIKHSAQSMMMMLNGLLDYNQLASGLLVLQHQPFNLRTTIDRTWSLHKFRAIQKGLDFGLEIGDEVPEVLVGDGLRMEQIITNLLSNAIKFTRAGSVDLQVTAVNTTPDEQQVLFVIKDTGIGIPGEAQQKIFHSYQQGSEEIARQYGGSGLGLHISKQLAEKMGGSLTVKSKVGQGSQFTLKVPFQLQQEG